MKNAEQIAITILKTMPRVYLKSRFICAKWRK